MLLPLEPLKSGEKRSSNESPPGGAQPPCVFVSFAALPRWMPHFGAVFSVKQCRLPCVNAAPVWSFGPVLAADGAFLRRARRDGRSTITECKTTPLFHVKQRCLPRTNAAPRRFVPSRYVGHSYAAPDGTTERRNGNSRHRRTVPRETASPYPRKCHVPDGLPT